MSGPTYRHHRLMGAPRGTPYGPTAASQRSSGEARLPPPVRSAHSASTGASHSASHASPDGLSHTLRRSDSADELDFGASSVPFSSSYSAAPPSIPDASFDPSRLPCDYAQSISWAHMCAMLTRLSELALRKDVRSKGDKRRAIVFPPEMMARVKAGETLFPYVRLLVPHIDIVDRPRYQLKEAKLAELFVDVYRLAPSHPDVAIIKNYKSAPVTTKHRASVKLRQGDFASVWTGLAIDRNMDEHFQTDATGRRVERHSTWTVRDVNDWLDRLSHAEDQAVRKRLFEELVQQVPPTEQKWIIREIMSDMKTGIKHESLLQWYHPDALEAYNSSLSLAWVLGDPALRDPLKRKKFSIRVCQSFQPMLAARFALDEKRKEFLHGWDDFFIEQKLDGERVVVHIRRPPLGDTTSPTDVMMLSRNNVGRVDYEQSMRERMLLAVPAREAILDGEMLVYDERSEGFLPFGKNRIVASFLQQSPTGATPLRHLCFMAFDLLWVSDWEPGSQVQGDLTQLPLNLRKQRLQSLLIPQPNYVEVLPTELVNAGKASTRREKVIARFEQAMTQGDEGLMLKKASSPYEFGIRSDLWLKLKPDYAQGAFETIGAVIVGGYYGDSFRGNQVRTFLVAVRHSSARVWFHDGSREATAEVRRAAAQAASSGSPAMWSTLVKVASGVTMEQLLEIRAKLKHEWQVVDKANWRVPKYMTNWQPAQRDKCPDVIVRDPSRSVILEVNGAQIVPTNAMAAGFTVRFPRIERIRDDLTLEDVATTRDVLDMFTKLGGSMASVAEDGEYGFDNARSRKRFREADAAAAGGASLLPQFGFSTGTGVTAEAHVLHRKRVVVLPHEYSELAAPYSSREVLQDLVRKLDGEPIANYTAKADIEFVIGLQQSERVQAFAARHDIDVLHPQWLLDCLAAHAAVPLEPEHVVYASARTKAQLAQIVDEYGEHHTRHTTPTALQALLRRLEVPLSAQPAGTRWFTTLTSSWDEDDVDAVGHEWSLFRNRKPAKLGAAPERGGCVAYVDVYPVVRTSSAMSVTAAPHPGLETAAFEYRLYGGVVAATTGEPGINLVITTPGCRADRLGLLRSACRSGHATKPDDPLFVVHLQWVHDCVREKRLLPVDKYLLD